MVEGHLEAIPKVAGGADADAIGSPLQRGEVPKAPAIVKPLIAGAARIWSAAAMPPL